MHVAFLAVGRMTLYHFKLSIKLVHAQHWLEDTDVTTWPLVFSIIAITVHILTSILQCVHIYVA